MYAIERPNFPDMYGQKGLYCVVNRFRIMGLPGVGCLRGRL